VGLSSSIISFKLGKSSGTRAERRRHEAEDETGQEAELDPDCANYASSCRAFGGCDGMECEYRYLSGLAATLSHRKLNRHESARRDTMCSRVTCPQCEKPTWAGCGQHIEEALAGVPVEDRCACEREDALR
jgi:hypothetical protein